MVSLYTLLTLVASTDYNLLINGQVVLPQLGVGLSIETSYILAPLILVLLHIHGLFILSTIARQLRSYRVLLGSDERRQTGSEAQTRNVRIRHHWDSLTAFPFVQLYHPERGAAFVARALVWLATTCIPLLLLFAVDLSFIRYQSVGITWLHHAILLSDFLLISWFGRSLYPRTASALPFPLAGRLFSIFFGRRSVPTSEKARRLVYLAVRAPAACFLLLVLVYAHPPSFEAATAEERRNTVWGMAEKGFWSSAISGDNILDAGPCKWWQHACRFLDVSEGPGVVFEGSSLAGTETGSREERNQQRYLDLNSRHLLFAKLHSVDLAGAVLRFAKLQGAELSGSNFRSTDLSDADLTGVQAKESNFEGANLLRANFNSAELWRANFRGAQMTTAEFVGANLHEAQLAGADLTVAYLQGANLMSAGLQGADLNGAFLQGADLMNAMLHGANLTGASLHGTEFGISNADGAVFSGAALGFTEGTPTSMYLTSLDGVKYEAPPKQFDVTAVLNSLPSREFSSLKHGSHSNLTIQAYVDKAMDRARQDQWTKYDWTYSWGKSNPKEWDMEGRKRNELYWEAVRGWAVDFACKNKFTALGTLRRWKDTNKMDGIEVPPAQWRLVQRALAEKRNAGLLCRGLADLPEGIWEKYMVEWR